MAVHNEIYKCVGGEVYTALPVYNEIHGAIAIYSSPKLRNERPCLNFALHITYIHAYVPSRRLRRPLPQQKVILHTNIRTSGFDVVSRAARLGTRPQPAARLITGVTKNLYFCGAVSLHTQPIGYNAVSSIRSTNVCVCQDGVLKLSRVISTSAQ